jgi:hypothetical protein
MRPIRLLGAAAVASVLLGASACGGDEPESEADVKEELSEALQRNGRFKAKAADCYADIVIEELGIDRVRDVEMSEEEPDATLAKLTVEATQRANEECELGGAGG